jgi:hypothetical protein
MRQAWRAFGLYSEADCRQFPNMEELLRSNDVVYLSFVRHVLAAEGIDFLQLDDHMSVMEGSVGVLPRRIMVPSDVLARAKTALGNATLTISE